MISHNKNNNLAKVFALLLVFASAQLLTACSSSGGGSAGPTVSIANVSIAEGNTGSQTLAFTLTLSVAATASTSVDYATADGTATTADSDYTAATGTLTIPTGSTTATIDVAINGDTSFETDEAFSLILSNAIGLSLGDITLTAQGTITNDDGDDPNGLYKASSGTFNSIAHDNLRGIVYNNRFIIFSEITNFLIDGTFDNILGNDYTATASVYSNGAIDQTNVPMTGTVNNGVSFTGSLNGNAATLGVGTFTLNYDAEYEKDAADARINSVALGAEWTTTNLLMFAPSRETNNYDTSVIAGTYDFPSFVGLATEGCFHFGTITVSDPSINIYSLTETITVTDIECTVSLTGYSGYATVVDDGIGGTDNIMLHAVTNGMNSEYGVFTR